MLALQLVDGWPQLIFEGDGGPIQLFLNTTTPINDGKWHTIHVQFDEQV